MLVTGDEDVGLSRTTSKHVTAREKSDVDHKVVALHYRRS